MSNSPPPGGTPPPTKKITHGMHWAGFRLGNVQPHSLTHAELPCTVHLYVWIRYYFKENGWSLGVTFHLGPHLAVYSGTSRNFERTHWDLDKCPSRSIEALYQRYSTTGSLLLASNVCSSWPHLLHRQRHAQCHDHWTHISGRNPGWSWYCIKKNCRTC